MLILRGRHTRFELGGSCAAVRTKAIVVLCARDDCTAIPDEKSEDVRSKANVTSPRIALLGAITRLGAAICMPPRVAKDIQFEFSHPQTAALVRRGRRARRAAARVQADGKFALQRETFTALCEDGEDGSVRAGRGHLNLS